MAWLGWAGDEAAGFSSLLWTPYTSWRPNFSWDPLSCLVLQSQREEAEVSFKMTEWSLIGHRDRCKTG